MRRPALAGFAAAWVAVLWAAPPTTVPAAVAGTVVAGQAAVEHRAAIVIDTGTEVKSVCVRFREESITGVEALARAQGVDPVFHGFAGKGAAVCALCGVGCPAGDSCLTCNPEGKFWSYSRAPAGTATLRTSGVGASSTTVRDGDVEGWKWALGGAPPFQAVEQVCGEAPAPTTSTPATPATSFQTVTTGAGGPATTRAAPAGASTTTRPPARTATTTAPRATTTAPAAPAPGDLATVAPAPATTAPTTSARPPTPELAASRRATGGDAGGGGSGPQLALFGVVLAGLVLWGALARRARSRQEG